MAGSCRAVFGLHRAPKRERIGVTPWVRYFLLDNYATIAEAVEAQKTFAFQIDSLILPNGFPTLVHLSLADKSGGSAVIEYIGSQAKVYHDKRFTVMTNEPAYDQQIENLKPYRTFGGDMLLPGERTPSDRFVRAAYYVNGLPQPANPKEAAAYMFSVIRNVSVPVVGLYRVIVSPVHHKEVSTIMAVDERLEIERMIPLEFITLETL